MAIGLFYESGGTAGGTGTSTNENRNIHEISAEMSAINSEITTAAASSAPVASAVRNTETITLLSDSDSDDGEVIMARPSAANQSEEEDLVFNSNLSTKYLRNILIPFAF